VRIFTIGERGYYFYMEKLKSFLEDFKGFKDKRLGRRQELLNTLYMHEIFQ
jgi:hypothetical protein